MPATRNPTSTCQDALQEARNMDRKYGEESITDRDWLGLRLWSLGYDDGWNRMMLLANPIDVYDRGEYVAGFARGQRDRLKVEHN